MDDPENFLDRQLDLVVIGAGINGAAAAREAALRGLRTLLIDKVDIASGTSSASSRLIHGGPRYLEHGEIRLVRESLRERELLLHTAPHLVRPYALLIPFYAHNRRPAIALRAGMLAYDVLSPGKSTPRHRTLSREELVTAYPSIERRGLQGGILYFDAYACFAERLAVEQALDVCAAGSSVRTHLAADGITAGSTALELELTDGLTGSAMTIQSRAVVNASGPWVDDVLAGVCGVDDSDRPLIGAVKGSHLVLAGFPESPATGIHYEAQADARPILVLPQADGTVLVGSTEVVEAGDPGTLRCSDEEIDYLLTETNRLLPAASVNRGHVLQSYAGARPLPYQPATVRPQDVSRDHSVVPHPRVPGLFSLTGGKLTTHRALGELAVDRIVDHLDTQRSRRRGLTARERAGLRRRAACSPTRATPLPGGRTADWAAFATRFAQRDPLNAGKGGRLLSLYGVRALRVDARISADPKLAAVVVGTDDVAAAEVEIAVTEEFARTLTDVMARRLMLSRTADAGLSVAPAVADLCAAILGWDRQRIATELSAYRSWSEALRPQSLATSDAERAARGSGAESRRS